MHYQEQITYNNLTENSCSINLKNELENFINSINTKSNNLNLINSNVFIIDGINKFEIIKKVSSLYCKLFNIKNETDVTLKTINREKLSSTAVGHKIAFPHCRSKIIQSVNVLCCILKNEIDWNAFDNDKVDIVFFIATPEEACQTHLSAIKILSQLIKETNFIKSIREIKDLNS